MNSFGTEIRVHNLGARMTRRGRFVLVTFAYTVLTAIVYWSAIRHLSSVLIGPPEDNLQDFWNTWYAAVAADYSHFFRSTLVRFPEGAPLNYHSFAYPEVFAVALLSKLFGAGHSTLILLQNLGLLISFPSAGVAAFYLVRRFTRSDPGSLLGGYVFAFNPSHIAHALHHMHVAHIEFIPLFVLAYLEAFDRKSFVWLAAALAFFALAALSCWYYLFYIGFFLVFHFFYLGFAESRPLSGWQLVAPLLCLAGVVVLLAPLTLPMVAMAAGNGVYAGGSNDYVADLEGLFAFPPSHLLASLSRPFYARATDAPWESVVYLGIVNCALLVWLFSRTRKSADATARYVFWGLVVFTIIAAGDSIHAFGYRTGLPLPGALFSHLPLFANVRAPSRAIVFVYLFLSIGAGHALTIAEREWTGKWVKPVLAGIAVLIVCDFFPVNLVLADARCPAGLERIRDDVHADFGVLNLPLAYADGNQAMFEQTCHGRPIVQASLSRVIRPSLVDHLPTNDLGAQKSALIKAHVKYIIVDGLEPDRLLPGHARGTIVFARNFPWLKVIYPGGNADSGEALKRYQRMYAASLARYRKAYDTVFQSRVLTILRVY